MIYTKRSVRKKEFFIDPDFKEIYKRRKKFQDKLKYDKNGKVLDENF